MRRTAMRLGCGIVVVFGLCAESAHAMNWFEDFDSYGNGSARGEHARAQGIEPSSADEYCSDLASNVSGGGSADGYWDFPWIWGCKRALG